ncbi:hypothetical protein Tco_1067638, partial [Tanacetum coccineum]
IMESLVKKKQKGAILELKRRHLKNTIFCTYTPYPAMKIRRISASSAQETRNDQFPIRHLEDGNGNMPTSPKPTVDYLVDLDYFKDIDNEFPAIVYNDGLTSKSDLGTKPLVISECINEFNLIDETSLSEYDEEIVSRFNNLFNDIHHDDLKSEKDDKDDDISIIQSSEDNEILHGENVFLNESR